jgi:hypothetical protein
MSNAVDRSISTRAQVIQLDNVTAHQLFGRFFVTVTNAPGLWGYYRTLDAIGSFLRSNVCSPIARISSAESSRRGGAPSLEACLPKTRWGPRVKFRNGNRDG